MDTSRRAAYCSDDRRRTAFSMLFVNRMNDDTLIELTPSNAQMKVHFTLDIEKDQSASETNGDDNQFRPEWPLQFASFDLLSCFVDQYIEGTKNTNHGN